MKREYRRQKAKKSKPPKFEPLPTEEELNQSEEEKRFPGYDPYYEKYQQDLVGFIETELGEVLTEDQKALCRSVVKNPVTIGKSANATGKTYIEARVAIWAYKCFPGVKIFTTAAPPEENLRTILWAEIGSIINRNKSMFTADTFTDLRVRRNPEEFITGVTIPVTGTREQRIARFSGKHAPYIFFILDEGDAIPAEVYEAIDSCMQGGHARLFIMFNPRSPMGPLYDMELEGAGNIVVLSAFTHPNVAEGPDEDGNDIVPGAVTRNKVVLRINRWSRPLVDGEMESGDCFDVPDFLVGYRAEDEKGDLMAPLPAGKRKVTNPALCYMVLAKYPSGGIHQLINPEWIEKARTRWENYVMLYGETPPNARPVLGHDVATEGEDWNVVYLRYGDWLPMPTKWQGVDADMAGKRGGKIAKANKVEHAFVDATGVGAGVPAKYRNQGIAATPVYSQNRATRKTEHGTFYRMRDQCLWMVREWLRDDENKSSTAMLPPSAALLQELRVLTYSNDGGPGGGQIRVIPSDELKDLLQRSPDDLMALAVTFAPRKRKAKNRGSRIVRRKVIR